MQHAPSHPGRLLFIAAILGAAGAAFVPTGFFASASSPICVGVVVDYGTSSSSAIAPATATQGVLVAAGTSDEQALTDTQPANTISTNASGLICTINDYPADGLQNCTAASGNKFYFWSYWEGNPATNTWTYASVGPASHTVSSGDTYVEGWRYQNPGLASPGATQPSVTPAVAFAQACPGVTPVMAPGAGSGTQTTSPSSGNTGETSTTQAAPSNGTGTAASAGVGASGSTSSQSAGRSTTTTMPSASGSTTTTVAPSGTTTSTIAEGSTVTSGTSSRRQSAAPAVSHGNGQGPGALSLAIAAFVVVALAGGAVFRWRRRAAEE